VKTVLGDEMGVNEIRPDLLDQAFYRDMAWYECKVEVIPAGGENVFRDARDDPVHRVVGYKMDFVPPTCEVFCPALVVDAAAVGDEEKDHGPAPFMSPAQASLPGFDLPVPGPVRFLVVSAGLHVWFMWNGIPPGYGGSHWIFSVLNASSRRGLSMVSSTIKYTPAPRITRAPVVKALS